MGLFLPQRWRQQPKYPVAIDWRTPFFDYAYTSEILCASMGLTRGLKNNATYSQTGTTVRTGAAGIGATFDVNPLDGITIAADADSVLDTTKCTMVIVRSLNTLTFQAVQAHGYTDNGGTSRAAAHIPFTDNNIYWDFGNATDGRTSASGQSWAIGAVDCFVLTAGSRGREIWRNGVLVGNTPGSTATRAAVTCGFIVGGAANNGTSGIDNSETVYLFGLCKNEWISAQITEFSKNVWQIFAPIPARRYFFPNLVNIGAGRPAFSVGLLPQTQSSTGPRPNLGSKYIQKFVHLWDFRNYKYGTTVIGKADLTTIDSAPHTISFVQPNCFGTTNTIDYNTTNVGVTSLPITLFIICNAPTTTTSVPLFVGSGTWDGVYISIDATNISMICTVAADFSGSSSIPLSGFNRKGLIVFAGSVRAGYLNCALNGVLGVPDTVFNIPTNFNKIQVAKDYGGGNSFNDTMIVVGVMNKALNDAELVDLTRNAWQVLSGNNTISRKSFGYNAALPGGGTFLPQKWKNPPAITVKAIDGWSAWLPVPGSPYLYNATEKSLSAPSAPNSFGTITYFGYASSAIFAEINLSRGNLLKSSSFTYFAMFSRAPGWNPTQPIRAGWGGSWTSGDIKSTDNLTSVYGFRGGGPYSTSAITLKVPNRVLAAIRFDASTSELAIFCDQQKQTVTAPNGDPFTYWQLSDVALSLLASKNGVLTDSEIFQILSNPFNIFESKPIKSYSFIKSSAALAIYNYGYLIG